ncbi:MAG: hypothetical protein AB8G96_08960 [Phycisphaerales bacterium]
MNPMRASADGPSLLLPIVLVITAAIGFLPAPWRLGWQSDLAHIVWVPLRPFSHGGVWVASWLRPSPSPSAGMSADRLTLDGLVAERDAAMRQVLAARQEIRRLEEQISELQQIPTSARDVARVVRLAQVTRRTPGRPRGPVELAVGRGTDDAGAVPEGAVAVHAGVHLLGRIRADGSGTVARGSVMLVPLASEDTGYIIAHLYVGSAERADEQQIADFVLPPDPALVQLAPTGTGAFEADVDRELPFRVGDEVRLADERWPVAAQQLLVGRIIDSRVKDSEPLRKVVTIEPMVTIGDVSRVLLLADDLGSALAASDDAAAPQVPGGSP